MLSIKTCAAVLAAGCLVLFAGAARASTIEVKVPFSFLVQGQTLPAGQYMLTRSGTDVVQITGERGTYATMFIMTMPAGGHDPAGQKPALTFKRDEKQYRLSGIWESETDGRTI